MIKFINHWMFASRLWNDTEPTSTAINLQEVESIDEVYLTSFDKRHVVIKLKNNNIPIPIEGDIVEVMAAFQKHLLTL